MIIPLLVAAVVLQDVTIDARNLPYEHVLRVPGAGAVEVTVVSGPEGFRLEVAFPEGVASNPHAGQGRVTQSPVRLTIRDRWGAKHQGRLVLRFRFTPEADPSEPNDDIGHARSIRPGENRIVLFPQGEVDVLAIEAPEPGYVEVSLPVPVDGMTLWAEIVDAAGQPLGTNAARVDLPGRYFLRVRDRWGGYASPEPFRIDVRLKPEFDPLEPNDTEELATRIDLGSWYPVALWPPGDVDVFEVVASAPGTLTPRVQGPIGDMVWKCGDVNGKEIAGVPCAVLPGRYRLSASSRFGDTKGEVLEFQIVFTPVLDDLEPNDEAPADIEVGRLYRVALSTPQDVDRYRVKVPGPGILAIGTLGPVPEDLKFTFDGAEMREPVRRVSGPVEVAVSTKSPTPFYITADWRRDEPGEPNDARENATRLPLGAPTDLRLWPDGDQDWFRVDVPGPGHLFALLHDGNVAHREAGSVEPIEVFDASGKAIDVLQQDPRRDDYRRTLRVQAAGPLYLRVAFRSGSSDQPIALTAHFLGDAESKSAPDAGGVVLFVLGLEPDERLTPELRLLALSADGSFMAARAAEDIAPALEEAVRRATADAERRGSGSAGWIALLSVAVVAGLAVVLLRRPRRAGT